jgi:2-polyprenyl-3-methyl-5-hydroxy-6-metoxy-1,4-benzoquinol methylase
MSNSASFPSSKEEIESTDFFNESWYYSVELVPGLYTQGAHHRNLGLTRSLLARSEVEGRSCLDIGTMESAVPVLLSRRGAAPIVAVDLFNCEDRIAAVKHYTGTEFEYYPGLTHDRTAPFLEERGYANFDIVVLSGVLYHCYGPMDVLAMARSLLRTGGLLIVETLATLDEEPAMFFNSRGRFSPDPTTFFLPSVGLLEYVLRYFQLAPLDAVGSLRFQEGGRTTGRVAVACRATNEVASTDDPWMRDAGKLVEYMTRFNWRGVDRTGVNPPAFEASPSRVIDRSTGTCDVTRTVLDLPPMELPERVARIALEDLY